jgi:hypothetical protein
LVSDTLFELLIELRYLLGSLAQFAQQPCVLNCDDGLSGEVGQQIDMFSLERSHFGSANYNRAERSALADQGYANDTAMTTLACGLSAASELVTRVLHIIDADGSHVANGTSRYGRTIQRKRQRPLNLAKPSKVSQVIVFDDKDIDVLSLTNVCSLVSY